MRVYTRRPPMQRFYQFVEPHGECWQWTGAKEQGGYGVFAAEPGRLVKAHRWLYEQLVADIPAGLQMDHLCRNRGCVNVFDHLDPVTPAVNTRRSVRLKARQVCRNGHRYDDTSTYVNPVTGKRACRVCARGSYLARRAAA